MMINKETGTYNMTNPGYINHNEILNLYKIIVHPNYIWKNFTEEEQNKILLSKRSNNILNTIKLTNYCHSSSLHLSDIRTAIKDVFHKMKSNIDVI